MSQLDAKQNIFYQSDCQRKAHATKQFDILIENGWVTPLQDGRVILSNDFYKIMQLFDSIVMTWAVEDGAKEVFYPDFYIADDLKKCNYIDQFHPHCFFTSISLTDTLHEESLSYSGFINNPAVCMHSYIQYQDSSVDVNNPIVITAKGKCKRNEHAGFQSLERLLDFTMREIIFIGSEKYVLSKRNEYMEKGKQLISRLQLEGNITVSNDPFFKKEDDTKAAFQQKFKLKYELNLKNTDIGHEVAVASFNYHYINFSKAYNISLTDSRLAHTACIAFGLERLAFTYITQVGFKDCYQQLEEYAKEMQK
jgi:seryl-tRNA synthetase